MLVFKEISLLILHDIRHATAEDGGVIRDGVTHDVVVVPSAAIVAQQNKVFRRAGRAIDNARLALRPVVHRALARNDPSKLARLGTVQTDPHILRAAAGRQLRNLLQLLGAVDDDEVSALGRGFGLGLLSRSI